MPGFIGAPKSPRHGPPHQRARAAAFAALPEWTVCARGGHPLWKWAIDRYGKSDLHYDHSDDNRGYIGFSCSACNNHDGARKGARAQRKKRHRAQPQPRTRQADRGGGVGGTRSSAW
jgi:hypothetical protein